MEKLTKSHLIEFAMTNNFVAIKLLIQELLSTCTCFSFFINSRIFKALIFFSNSSTCTFKEIQGPYGTLCTHIEVHVAQ